MLSQAYVDLLTRGPFPNQIDPWAEDAHYFQQVHGNLLTVLAQHIKPRLNLLGYMVGREASLQVLERREPDIFVRRITHPPEVIPRWSYPLVAEEGLADPGEVLEAEIDMDALHIRHLDSGDLVTIIEVISPANKDKPELITDYRQRRERLVIEKQVQVVEIDLTRSVKRLVFDPLAKRYPYHVALHLVTEKPRLVGMHIGQPLATIAVPLRGEVLTTSLQTAWNESYQVADSASNILHDHGYAEAKIPFPSLLTDEQRIDALKAVNDWKAELHHLRQESA